MVSVANKVRELPGRLTMRLRDIRRAIRLRSHTYDLSKNLYEVLGWLPGMQNLEIVESHFGALIIRGHPLSLYFRLCWLHLLLLANGTHRRIRLEFGDSEFGQALVLLVVEKAGASWVKRICLPLASIELQMADAVGQHYAAISAEAPFYVGRTNNHDLYHLALKLKAIVDLAPGPDEKDCQDKLKYLRTIDYLLSQVPQSEYDDSGSLLARLQSSAESLARKVAGKAGISVHPGARILYAGRNQYSLDRQLLRVYDPVQSISKIRNFEMFCPGTQCWIPCWLSKSPSECRLDVTYLHPTIWLTVVGKAPIDVCEALGTDSFRWPVSTELGPDVY